VSFSQNRLKITGDDFNVEFTYSACRNFVPYLELSQDHSVEIMNLKVIDRPEEKEGDEWKSCSNNPKISENQISSLEGTTNSYYIDKILDNESSWDVKIL